MNTRISIEKLDRRHKGYGAFSHRIRVMGQMADILPKFLEIREWCWFTWNPSCEREMFLTMRYRITKQQWDTLAPKHWCWHYEPDYSECYIYLTSAVELNMFLLKWQ